MTLKQAETLRYIKTRTKIDGKLPSYRMICDYFGWQSINSAKVHVYALRRKEKLNFTRYDKQPTINQESK